LGSRKGIRPVKKLEWWVVGMVTCLQQSADLHMAQLMPLPLTVSFFSKMQIGFTILVPAHPSSSRQRVIKQVCVCIARKDAQNTNIWKQQVKGKYGQLRETEKWPMKGYVCVKTNYNTMKRNRILCRKNDSYSGFNS